MDEIKKVDKGVTPSINPWIQVSKCEWVHSETGDTYISLFPRSRALEMVVDEREKAYILDSLWALKDKDESRNFFIQTYLDKYPE